MTGPSSRSATQLRRLSDLAKAGAVTAGELMTAPPLTVPDVGLLRGIVSRADLLKTFGGRIRDTSLVPVAARLVRAVEGVVDVTFDLSERGRPWEPSRAPSSR